MIARREWLSTAQIAEEAGVHATTLQRWAKQGLLPTPTLLSMGRKGRFHRWPPESLEQARWVRARVDELWTPDEILEALKRGEFKPTPSERQDE